MRADLKKIVKDAQCHGRLPSCVDICLRHPIETQHLPEIFRPEGGEDSFQFFAMVTGGPCAVCSRWAGFPPCTSDLSVRLCGREQCLAELRSDRHTHKNWSLTGSSKRFFLPSEVSFWVPYYADVADICRKQKWQPSNCRTVEGPYPTYIKRRGCRFLLDDLNSAMSDVCSLDLDASYLEVEHAPWSLSDWHRENKLSKVLAINYKERANAHGALETIYWAILEWHRQSYEAGKSIRKANLAVLATIAEDRGTTLEAVQKDDRTQRVLAAFSRDLEHVSLSTFHYLPPVEKDRRKCNTRNPRADPKKVVSTFPQMMCPKCRNDAPEHFATWSDLKKHLKARH